MSQMAVSDHVSSIEVRYHLHYEVLSPRRSRWQRLAGPFISEADARTHLEALEGVVAHRITETTTTTRVIEQRL